MSRAEYKQRVQNASLVAELYRCWEQFEVPAIHYHYLLSVLPMKAKHQQGTIISAEINRLRKGTDPYHRITPWVQAREAALLSIKTRIRILLADTSDPLEGNASSTRSAVDQSGGYQLVFQSSTSSRQPEDWLGQFISNVKAYRKATVEAILRIRDWQKEVEGLGYEGVVQFLFQRQDYYERLEQDTVSLLQEYDFLFQNNVLLLLKRQHQSSEYALVYRYLRVAREAKPQYLEALEIIEDHRRAIQRQRLLKRVHQTVDKTTIRKAASLQSLLGPSNSRIAAPYLKKQLAGPQHKPSTSIKKALRNPEEAHEQQSLPIGSKIQGRSQVQQNRMLQREFLCKDRVPEFDGSRSQRQRYLFDSPVLLASSEEKSSAISEAILEQHQSCCDNPSEQALIFMYQTGIEQREVFQYLREKVFHGQKADSEIEGLTQMILRSKHWINLVRVTAGPLEVAWMALSFHHSQLSARGRATELKFIHQYVKTPNLQMYLLRELANKGYSILKATGKLLAIEGARKESPIKLVEMCYKVGQVEGNDFKKLVKGDPLLKKSRVLKFYTYSSNSKYHAHCEHQTNECHVSLSVEVASKVQIEGKTYIRTKCDWIERKGRVWIVKHAVSKLWLLLAQSLNELLQEVEPSDRTQEQAQLTSNPCKKSYLCMPEVKSARHYVNEVGQPFLVQYMKIGCSSKEQNAVVLLQNDLSDYLVLSEPFTAALADVGSQKDYKIVAVFSVD